MSSYRWDLLFTSIFQQKIWIMGPRRPEELTIFSPFTATKWSFSLKISPCTHEQKIKRPLNRTHPSSANAWYWDIIQRLDELIMFKIPVIYVYLCLQTCSTNVQIKSVIINESFNCVQYIDAWAACMQFHVTEHLSEVKLVHWKRTESIFITLHLENRIR